MNLNIRNEEINAKIIIAVKKATFAVAKRSSMYTITVCTRYKSVFVVGGTVILLLVQNFLLTLKIAISKSNSLAQCAETKKLSWIFLKTNSFSYLR